MQRRRIAVAAAVVAAVGAAVAFTLPSMAGTTPSAGRTLIPGSGGGVSPQILAAMQRDMGLGSDQAATRLKRSKWASGVSSTLAAKTGGDFGGAWIASDGTTLKVAVTGEDAADAVRQAGAVPVLVKHSEAALDTTKAKIDSVRSEAAGVTSWYVDVPTNNVVVVAKPDSVKSARALIESAGVPAGEVTIKTSSAAPKPLFDVRGADPYFISLAEGTARCSIGFSVEGGFVTAGHCGKPGDVTVGFNKEAQGEVKASVFPGNADMGFVAVNGNWTPRPVVNDFAGHELPVAGSTEAPVGAAVCRSGSTTGTHCGTIEAKNQTVVYPEGAVTGLTRTNVCAEAGDSGGPWLSGDQAQGVTSGGSGDCTAGGETFFQPVNEILATDKLTLVTTSNAGGNAGNNGGNAGANTGNNGANTGDNGANAGDNGGNAGASAAPPAGATTAPTVAPTDPGTNPPADDTAACASLPVQRTGDLSEEGTGQAQPNGGAFRSQAGVQTACLNAPDSAQFDLFLQQFNGRNFKTVAKATGAGDKTLTFNGRAGTYRYVVADAAGSGSYTLSFDVP